MANSFYVPKVIEATEKTISFLQPGISVPAYRDQLHRVQKLLRYANAIKSRCKTEINLSIDEFDDISQFYEVD